MACVGNSCACKGVNVLFDEKTAKSDYKHYLKKGPHKTTQRLIDALKKEELEGKSLIDIGGGVGAIHHALLDAGVATATNVDGSQAYIEKSKEESARLKHENKLKHHFGDYVELAEEVGEADIITLDKVICCYKDMRDLVTKSSAKARKFYGVIYPVDRWWMRLFSKVANVFVRLKSREFQSYIHSEVEIESIIRNHGFARKYYYKNIIWQVILYAK